MKKGSVALQDFINTYFSFPFSTFLARNSISDPVQKLYFFLQTYR